MHTTKRILAPTLMVLVLAALLVQLPGMAAERSDSIEWSNPIVDVRRILRDHFVEDVDEERLKELQEAAIRGMLDSLDDPYTTYIPAEYEDDFEKNMGGTYVGIGAEVNLKDGWFTIISPMPNSPALEAGLEAGDQVRSIDPDGPDGPLSFETTEGEPIDESIDRLMGEPGTKVAVMLHRREAPADEVEEIVITRRRIRVQTVEGVHRDGENWDFWSDPEKKIAYVRLTQFTGTTYAELRNVMVDLVRQGLRGLVLDLRFNPGGRMDASIQIADLFVPEGRIVSLKGRSVDEAAWDAHERGTLPDFPMIALVNGQSASASEIVAGALKDNDRAVILGTRTYGKGKVQDIKTLTDGAGQLKITTAYYYLPSGRNLQRVDDSNEWGVDPSPGMYVPLTNSEYRALLEVQRELDVIGAINGDGDWANPAWIEERLSDPQLAAALRSLRHRLDDGEWLATGQELSVDAEVLDDLRRTERRRELLEEELELVNEEIDRLMAFAPESDKVEIPDVNLPADKPLKGGTIEIRDAQGELIRTFSINDRDDLLVGLIKARVSPVEDESDASETQENTGGDDQ